MRARTLLPRTFHPHHISLPRPDQHIHDHLPLILTPPYGHIPPTEGQVSALDEHPPRAEFLDPAPQGLEVGGRAYLPCLGAALTEDEVRLRDVGREDGGVREEMYYKLLDGLMGEECGS